MHMPVSPVFRRLRKEDCPGLRPARVRDPVKELGVKETYS